MTPDDWQDLIQNYTKPCAYCAQLARYSVKKILVCGDYAHQVRAINAIKKMEQESRGEPE